MAVSKTSTTTTISTLTTTSTRLRTVFLITFPFYIALIFQIYTIIKNSSRTVPINETAKIDESYIGNNNKNNNTIYNNNNTKTNSLLKSNKKSLISKYKKTKQRIIPPVTRTNLYQDYLNANDNNNINATTINFHECTYGNQSIRIPQYPTFVIAGAQKTGTTSLFSYLVKHPLMARPAFKEPHFLDVKIINEIQNYRTLYPYSDAYYNNDNNNSTISTSTLSFAQKQKRHEDGKWCYIRQQYASQLSVTPIVNINNHNDNINDKQQQNVLPFGFEKSPSYLHSFMAPQNLKFTCPWIPKVIIVLRNPVDRAYSQYTMNNFGYTFEQWIEKEIRSMREWNMTTAPPFIIDDSNDNEQQQQQQQQRRQTKKVIIPWDHPVDGKYWKYSKDRAFNEKLTKFGLFQAIRKGIYAPQIKNWLDVYPKDAMMIIDYHQLHENTTDVYYRILDFVGIPRDVIEPLSSSNINKLDYRARQRKDFVPMSNQTREYLEAFYAPYNSQLADILGEEWRDIWTTTTTTT